MMSPTMKARKKTRRARNRDRNNYDRPKTRLRTLNRYRVGLPKGRLAPPIEPKPVGAIRRIGREWVVCPDGAVCGSAWAARDLVR